MTAGEEIRMQCRGKKGTAFFGNRNLHYKCPTKILNINKILVLQRQIPCRKKVKVNFHESSTFMHGFNRYRHLYQNKQKKTLKTKIFELTQKCFTLRFHT